MLREAQHANNVLKTRITAAKDEMRRVWSVQQVRLRRKAVPNVSCAVRGRLVLGAKIARVGTPEHEATTILLNVNNVSGVKRPRCKVRQNAILAMLEHLAKPKVFVQNARMVFIKTTKREQNVSNATMENCTSIPKQLAVLVALVDLAAAKVFVRHAHWVMPEKETTMMRLNVNNVNWVKQQRLKVPLNAMIVMLEHLAKRKVFVQNARMDFIKTTKEEQNVLNVHWENCTSMPKQHAVVVTLVRLVAGMAFATVARLGSIKIPNVKQSAVFPVTWQKKYPTKRVPGVNCHRGVPAKWANI